MNTKANGIRWNWLYKVSGSAALAAAVLLLVAVTGFFPGSPQPDSTGGGYLLFQNNWLATIMKLHAGFTGARSDQLVGVNPFDFTILALVGILHCGLYAALRKTSRIGSILALVQPFLGIALFMMTKTAGRCTVMGAGLVISVVMLRSDLFGKMIPSIGLMASIFLLAGDVSLSAAHSLLLAILTAVGYILLIAWLFLIANRFFRLGQSEQVLAAVQNGL